MKLEIENIKHRIKDLEKLVESVTRSFRHYITDKRLSLEERWELFTNAPSCLKRTSGFMVRFKCLDHYKSSLGRNPAEDEIYSSANRGEVMDTISIIEELKESLETPDEEARPCISLEDIPKLQEEILSENLGGITFDW